MISQEKKEAFEKDLIELQKKHNLYIEPSLSLREVPEVNKEKNVPSDK